MNAFMQLSVFKDFQNNGPYKYTSFDQYLLSTYAYKSLSIFTAWRTLFY